MEQIYVIYKENVIPGVGGTQPLGIEIGLAEYNGWKLAKLKLEDFNKFSEFKLIPIDEELAVGLIKNSVNSLSVNEADIANNNIFIEKTEQDINLINEAKKFIDLLDLKFITRSKIREFKDFESDLADTKLLIEFILKYLSEDFSNKDDASKNKMKYSAAYSVLSSFLATNPELKLNDKTIRKIPTIIEDEDMIYRLVKTNYFDRKKFIEQ